MSIRRPRALALPGLALLALSACNDLLQDEASDPARVLVQLKREELGRVYRAGYPMELELFVSDGGGLGVADVEVRWAADPGSGTVAPTRERTNGNGFVEATWTAGTRAGEQRVRVEVPSTGLADTVSVPILPDTVVGTVEIGAEADTLVEGETQTISLLAAGDRHGNGYTLTRVGQGDGLPSLAFATLDPEVLEVAPNGVAALVTGRAPGTGRVVASVGGRADTVTVVVKEFVAPGSFRGVRAGAYFTCGATRAGAAHCWGENGSGQLGLGEAGAPVPAPAALPALAGVEVDDFAMGDFHACAVAAGDVWCWGDNSAGQLGDGGFDPRATPAKVQRPDGVSFVAVGAGIVHSCALASDGSAWCWGDNSLAQAGTGGGPGDPIATPTRVAAPEGVSFTRLSLGGIHACALTEAGTAWCWGDNGAGQLGTGSMDPVTAPAEVRAGGAAFRQVGAGLAHTCAVTTAGEVRCWGDNSSGQLGNGGTDSSPSPVVVSGTLAAVEVSAGVQHSCAVAADGRVFCWGFNGSGRLGNDSEQESPVPVEVQSGDRRFQSVDLGNEHSCALGTDNEAYCWGLNAVGEVGNGSTSGAVLRPSRVISPGTPAAARARARTSAAPARPRAMVSSAARPAVCRHLPPRSRAKLDVCR